MSAMCLALKSECLSLWTTGQVQLSRHFKLLATGFSSLHVLIFFLWALVTAGSQWGYTYVVKILWENISEKSQKGSLQINKKNKQPTFSRKKKL
jgi:hypothetical protein